jgi:hypothetical protein
MTWSSVRKPMVKSSLRGSPAVGHDPVRRHDFLAVIGASAVAACDAGAQDGSGEVPN